MKKFKIYTLGCKVNQYDSESLSRKLLSAGFMVGEDNVTLVIVNTCTVTHSAIAKDKKMIEKARQENPKAKIAVVGCMPVNYRAEVEKLGVDYIFGTKEADKLVVAITNDQLSIINENSEIENLLKNDNCELKINKTSKSRYFIKVQDGCQQFCSYCIIPYNRGKLTSRPADEVINEIKQIVKLGYKEIILCGIHLGLYGVDFNPPSPPYQGGAISPLDKGGLGDLNVGNLVDLLKELIRIEGLEKIRLSSIEVIDVNDELIELMNNNRKICRHLHIPLQSGCDKILKLMNRPYTTEYFADKINKLRSLMPEIAITTDVIVGFPGETDSDFKITEEFIKKINFSKLHVFPFSAHEKTPAYTFPDQLSQQVKVERAKVLSRLSEQLEKDYKQKFVGQVLDVIVDGRSREKKYRAKSEYFFDVEFESEEKLRVGEWVLVKGWKLI